MRKRKAALFWSGGKDAALAYWKVRNDDSYAVTCLITTVSDNNKVSMHDIPIEIVREQARQMELPLIEMKIKPQPSNTHYEEQLKTACEQAVMEFSVEVFLFGDIYLEDIRAYRINLFNKLGYSVAFPLWQEAPSDLFQKLIDYEIIAQVVVVDSSKIDPHFLGKTLNQKFKETYPAEHDLCGEDGAFHTVVIDTPFFKEKIKLPDYSIKTQELSVRTDKQVFYFSDFVT